MSQSLRKLKLIFSVILLCFLLLNAFSQAEETGEVGEGEGIEEVEETKELEETEEAKESEEVEEVGAELSKSKKMGILHYDNLSGEEGYGYISDVIIDLTSSSFNDLENITLLPRSEIIDYIENENIKEFDEKVLRKTAKALNLDIIVKGEFEIDGIDGNEILIYSQAINSRNFEIIASYSNYGSVDDLFGFLSKYVDEFKESLKEELLTASLETTENNEEENSEITTAQNEGPKGPKKKVAIMNLVNLAKPFDDNSLGKDLSEKLYAKIQETGNFDLIPFEKIVNITQNGDYISRDFIDENVLKEIGEKLETEIVIGGSYIKAEEMISINAFALEVGSGIVQTTFSEIGTLPGIASLIGTMSNKLSEEISKTIAPFFSEIEVKISEAEELANLNNYDEALNKLDEIKESIRASEYANSFKTEELLKIIDNKISDFEERKSEFEAIDSNLESFYRQIEAEIKKSDELLEKQQYINAIAGYENAKLKIRNSEYAKKKSRKPFGKS